MLESVAMFRRDGLSAIAGALILAALCGCTAKKPLAYKPPESRLKPGGAVIACTGSQDFRRNRDIDEALEEPPATSLDAAIQGEIAASGLAEKVVVLPFSAQPTMAELRSQGVRFLIEPVLHVMDLEVPGSEGKQAMSALFRFLNASAEVDAQTEFSVRMFDLSSNRHVTKTYRGSAKSTVGALGSDTSSAISRLAGQSLHLAVHPFWSDLAAFVRAQPTP